jgi:predicted MFS family arabinose efflux permease
MLVDAVSFLGSALAIGQIRAPEAPPAIDGPAIGFVAEIREGIQAIGASAILRALLGVAMTTAVGGGMIGALYSLFVIRELGLPPIVLGAIIGFGGIGSLIGALIAERVARRIGLGRTLVGGLAIGATIELLIPFAGGPAVVAAGVLLLAQCGDIAGTIFAINELGLRQAIVPDRLRGRVGASFQFLTAAVAPIGAIAAGLLGEAYGLRLPLAIGVLLILAAAIRLFFSPVRQLQRLPATGQAGQHE